MALEDTILSKGLFVCETKSLDTATETTLWVKGFASISGADRVGDNIDPRLFSVSKFMEDPQLWLDHSLIEKQNADGTTVRTNVGLVRQMNIVSVDYAADGKSFSLVDTESGAAIDTIDNLTKFTALKDGQRGLWVKAEIMEPSIVKLVDEGRINSFSWQGHIIRRKSGTVKSIDLIEVSLVYNPANANSRFLIGKSLDGSAPLTCAVLYSNGAFEERNLDDAPLSDYRDVSNYLVIAKSDTGLQRCYFETEETARQGAMSLLADADDAVVLRSKHAKTEDGGRAYDFVCVAATLERKAVWDAAYVNTLPDSSFGFIEPGGSKDSENKTTPRSLRHFPIKDASGKPDRAHVMNALARLSQSPFGEKARGKVEAAARALGIGLQGDKKKTDTLTTEERMLLDTCKSSDSSDGTAKGGDLDMTTEELQAQLNPIATALKALSDGITGIDTRLSSLETSRKSTEEGEAKAKETAAAEKKSADEAAAAAAASAAEDGTKKALGDIIGAMENLTKTVMDMGGRMDKLEGKPAKSKQLREGADGSDEEEAAPVLTMKALREKYTKADWNAMLADTFVADGVGAGD